MASRGLNVGERITFLSTTENVLYEGVFAGMSVDMNGFVLFGITNCKLTFVS